MIDDVNLIVDIGNTKTVAYQSKQGQPVIFNIYNNKVISTLLIFSERQITFGNEDTSQANENSTFRNIIHHFLYKKKYYFEDKTDTYLISPQTALASFFKKLSDESNGSTHFYTIIPAWWPEEEVAEFAKAAEVAGVSITPINSFDAIVHGYFNLVDVDYEIKYIVFDIGSLGIQCYKFATYKDDFEYQNYSFIEIGNKNILKCFSDVISQQIGDEKMRKIYSKKIGSRSYKNAVEKCQKDMMDWKLSNFKLIQEDINLQVKRDDIEKTKYYKQISKVLKEKIAEFIGNDFDYHIEILGNPFAKSFISELIEKNRSEKQIPATTDAKCYNTMTESVLCYGGVSYYINSIKNPNLISKDYGRSKALSSINVYRSSGLEIEHEKKSFGATDLNGTDIVPNYDEKDYKFIKSKLDYYKELDEYAEIEADMDELEIEDYETVTKENKEKALQEGRDAIKQMFKDKGFDETDLNNFERENDEKIKEIYSKCCDIGKQLKDRKYIYTDWLAPIENANAQVSVEPEMSVKENY
ncbi:hypothetical protein TVAG_454590 [Trichomonas vaginalis G3]|uniref:Uncharacterized protein n=1 Tax=Trichomonas vaginalis (strain ATCC PRA-98 / G3) TaxID=412133 RepID=A2EU72_TRIV3|nr:hypothetical protein TVAGG3_0231400 [Trichomonas vaginalis G3]EAY03820.1 hypothetical protein TVAG_454590 [Trichomonas vaginalis G3]KAI5552658.1 hypothetical protein TVAGG3_0231400 [Trichomonas vaginalis G3]|eukprot:XP_001316043.1 hypothetical protein [Trichomonas vaginalis G3]